MADPFAGWRARGRLAAAAAVLALAVPIPAGADSPSPSPTVAPTLPISVRLSSLTPLAPQHGDVLRLTGTLRNVSSQPVSDLQVQFRYDPTHIGSRSQFDNYLPGCNDSRTYSPLPLPGDTGPNGVVTSRTLPPGRSERFSLQVPVDSLSLDRPWQVFAIGVQVNGSTTQGFGGVGGLRTVLPWAPVELENAGAGAPTQVAWVWPLVDQPHRSVATTFTDDALARSLAPSGRLGELLAAGVAAQNQQPAPAPPVKKKTKKAVKPPPRQVAVSPVPVTWAVDPMLVEDAELMAGGYKVTGNSHGSTTGSGTDSAKTWLAQLRAAVSKSDLLALPYADPDVVAAEHNGLQAEVQVATNRGQTMLSRALQTGPLTYAWPPGGFLDEGTLDTLFAAGVSTVLLDDRAVPPATDPSVTPSAHTSIRGRDGNLDALLTDHTLDCVVMTGNHDRSTQRLATQRFLAETLMIQAERPSNQRTVVVTPDRRWAPDPAYAAALVSGTGKVPWIRPVSLSEALASPPSPVTRLGLTYPPQAHFGELSDTYLQQVVTLQRSADYFAEILQTGDPNARAFDDALLRTLSSAWRTQPDRAASFRDRVADTLSATKHKVRIASAPGSFVTLTSHSGTVPVTVANELGTPVRVTVEISSQHLQVSGGGRVAETIPPHRQIAVDVRATARTSGVFPLDVTLLTPNGHPYDGTQHLFVRSTAYGLVAIVITGGATGMLLIAVVIRLVRRGLTARRAATGTA